MPRRIRAWSSQRKTLIMSISPQATVIRPPHWLGSYDCGGLGVALSATSSGTERISVVPCGPLDRSIQPPTVVARSCRPRMPNERDLARSSWLTPRPLSLISSESTPPASERSIRTRVACACLLMLVSASCAVR